MKHLTRSKEIDNNIEALRVEIPVYWATGQVIYWKWRKSKQQLM